MQKHWLSVFLITGTVCFYSCNTQEYYAPIHDPYSEEHPRLLWLENEEEQIRDLIASDETWQNVHNLILEETNSILEEPELERVMIGRRLLHTSRELLRRMFFLSYSYRMTNDKRYLVKAREELLAVSKFYDWNPSHFLDAAEMTMGVAIGYDWLYHDLSNNTRYEIKNAIINKGLVPSQDSKYNWWLDSEMNWNQVCNAGMVFGAIAIQQEYPRMAREIIDRAIRSIPQAMEAYEPDGVYPEGYTYWGYGTTFNLLFIDALEKRIGESYSQASVPGFSKTGHFIKHMVTPTLGSFNWSDCSIETNLLPAMFWFASRTNNPDLLWSERQFLEQGDLSDLTSIRYLPALLLWAKNISTSSISAPADKFWIGQGPNPVAMMRSSWTDPDAMYLGFKAGSPSHVHGHMDIGSFVMEAEGIRWAADLGHQNYESLESLGMNIFVSGQKSDRWDVFRMNSFSHNVLIIDDKLQHVNGYAEIDRHSNRESFMFSISDISTIYDGQLQKAVRGVGIKEGKYTVIRDEISTLKKSTRLRWNMITFASVALGDKMAKLTEDEEVLHLKVQGPDNLHMNTWSAEPAHMWDAENPGTTIVGFECEVPAYSSASFEVLLIPERFEAQANFTNITLDEWE